MSWLSSLRNKPQPESRSIRTFADSVSWDNTDLMSGDNYGRRRVAGIPTVAQALDMISGDCAKVPANVFARLPDGDRKALPDHRAAGLIDLFGIPNEDDTTYDLLFDWFFHALIFGGGYLWIERDGPYPIALHPLLPDRTRQLRQNGRKWFVTEVWTDANTPYLMTLPNVDVLYLAGVSLDGLKPDDPIRLYRSTFEQSIAKEDFTANFFENGSHAGGILMVPPGASEPAIANVEKAVEARRDRSNWFKTLILKDNFRWQSTTSDAKSASLVELDEPQARNVARVFKIPPSKLGIPGIGGYNSLDKDNQNYFDSTLSPWLIQARSQFHRKLLLPSEQRSLFVDYTIDALLWADPATRANIATQGINTGWIKRSEVRRWFNQPKMDGIDDAPANPSQPTNA